MTDLLGRRPWLTGVIVVSLLAAALTILASVGVFGRAGGRAAASPVRTTTTSTTSTTTSTSTTTTTTEPPTTEAPPDTSPPEPAAAPAPRRAAPTPAAPAADPPPPAPAAPAGGFDYGAANQIIAFMNGQRAKAGVGPLAADGCLTSLAQGWAQSMGNRQAMSHNPGFASCNGTAGENVGMWSPCNTAAVENWWMNSSGHRDNILSPTYATTGVGVWIDGNGACWYAVDFGP